jgi:hypothetical protein
MKLNKDLRYEGNLQIQINRNKSILKILKFCKF